jgi:hypothetical protein
MWTLTNEILIIDKKDTHEEGFWNFLPHYSQVNHSLFWEEETFKGKLQKQNITYLSQARQRLISSLTDTLNVLILNNPFSQKVMGWRISHTVFYIHYTLIWKHHFVWFYFLSWYLSLTEKQIFENGVLRRIFLSKRKEETR